MGEEMSLTTLDSQVSTELSVIEAHLGHLEMEIAYEHKKAEWKWPRKSYDPETDGEIGDWIESMVAPHIWVDIMYSRILRGPFLIGLYSTLETTVTRTARLVGEREGLGKSLDDYKKGSFLQRARKHFKDDLPFPLPITAEQYKQLNNLRRLRNAFAHYNARIDLMDENKRSELKDMETNREGIWLGIDFIDVSNEFLREAFDAVRETLEGLVKAYDNWNTREINPP